jgi:hypothetical protein
MSRKQSLADVLAERDTLKTREHVLSIAYTELPNATYRHRDGRDVYTWKAYRLAGHSGGYLVGTFDGFQNRHRSLLYVEYFDTAAKQVSERGSSFRDCGMCDAVYKFNTLRYELLHKTA